MKVLKLILALSMFFVASADISRAQNPTPSPSPADTAAPEVSASKRALIKEILDLTNSRTGSEAMFTAQFTQMEKQLPEAQWQAISSTDEFKKLTAAQQEQLHTRIKESSGRSTQRMKELFLERVDLKRLVENISYTVYDKHFTEAELTDLAAFYRSPTGKKVVAEMPALFADSIAKGSEIVSPKIQEIFDEVQKEETERLTKEIDKVLKAPAKPAATRRSSRRPRS